MDIFSENDMAQESKIKLLQDEIQKLYGIIEKFQAGKDELNNHTLLQLLEERICITEDLIQIGTWEYDLIKKVIWGSYGAFRIYGLQRENDGKINLKTLLRIQNEEEIEKLDKAVQQLIKKNNPFDVYYKITKENDSGQKETRIINSKAKLIFDDNNIPVKVIGTVQDVTLLKKNEREFIRAKEKAEESEKLKTIFLENMSHEIRTPMNAILGYTELLNIGPINEEKRKKYTEIIKNKGNFLLSLIDDIIEFSRFESGKITISPTECNLNFLMKELQSQFHQRKSLHGKENLKLILNIPNENRPFPFYTDSGRLQQVLTNLLDNALKYTEKGEIEFGYKVNEDNSKLHFFVNDTGSGVPKEKHKIIFERFRQVEDTLTLRSSGSGLGLTISKNIIDLMDGKLWLDSEKLIGASFNFTLPFNVIKPEENIEINEINHDTFQLSNYVWKDKVIVVAEDDEINYMFLETLLHETQAQVIRAISGLQVIELVKSLNKIDMILMDIKMPDMNGYEAAREVKSLNYNIPIIAQTAYSMKDDKEKSLEAGCDDYIAKPIIIETLLKKMNTYFQ